MRFAISIPQFVSDGQFDPARFRAYMARAESLGFESAWTLEQTLGTMPFMSPLQTMSYAVACTERIRLGCVVFVTPLHSPVHLAKDLSTLDQLSRGRIEIGVGTGRRRADPAQSGLRRGRADGAPGGRGRADILLIELPDDEHGAIGRGDDI